MFYTTAGLHGPKIEAYWKEIVCSTYVPLNCEFLGEGTFESSICASSIGGAELTHVKAAASRFRRTKRELQSSESDEYLVCVLKEGVNRFSQADRSIELEAGDLWVIDTARPYSLDCPTRYEALLLKVPRRDFIARFPLVEHCVAQRISTSGLYGQLAATVLNETALQLRDQGTPPGGRLMMPILDLIGLALEDACSQDSLPSIRYLRIAERAKEVLMDHLFDPEFNVSLVPSMIGVSTRTLSRAFAESGEAPSRWLWQKRLDAARGMLLSPRRPSVLEVAMTCGFNDMSHFSRAFKKRFGTAPSCLLKR